MSRLSIALLSYLLMAEGVLCQVLYVFVACPLRGIAMLMQAWTQAYTRRVEALARAANYPTRSSKP